MERVQKDAIYQNRVFFIRNLGFVTPTEARRITFEETLRFEKIHEETYKELGFELISIGPGSVAERANTIKTLSSVEAPGLSLDRDFPGAAPARM